MRTHTAGKKVIRNVVSERVREARVKQALTQDQLSGQLAIKGIALDRVAITKIESGFRCVFDYEVRALANVLKVDIRWLLNMEERTGKGGGKAIVSEKHRQ